MTKHKDKWGIWNDLDKRFVFGISELTANQAERSFRRIAPKAYRCWRYHPKRIPEGFVNPVNKKFK